MLKSYDGSNESSYTMQFKMYKTIKREHLLPCMKLKYVQLKIASNAVLFNNKKTHTKQFTLTLNIRSAELDLTKNTRVRHIPFAGAYQIFKSMETNTGFFISHSQIRS